jgi:glycosyltransferase involved in cell wall biosynthesis
MNLPHLLLVIPCYNEEAILEDSYQKLILFYNRLKQTNLIDPESKICLVDDGSRDRTWSIINQLSVKDETIMGVKLSRNFGHQSAIMAGLDHFRNDFDCFITIDADLQDDVNAIVGMIEKYKEGAAVVYGVRDDRSSDSWFKRVTAEGFYTIMQKMGVPVVFNHADFRLMDRRILQELQSFKEINLFIRGVIPLVGFKNDKVYYKRLERTAGETKYPLQKMLLFAWNGITSFSNFPMRLVLYGGVITFLISILVSFYIIFSFLFGYTAPGWSSTLLIISVFSGFNMVALGLIGEYVGKIYEEVKGRPRYIIETITNE